MARKQNKTTPLVVAVLTLAGKYGWTAVTPAKLAKAAKVTAKEAAAFMASSAHSMHAIADFVTEAAQRDYRHDPRNSSREALFEILMLRFDVLQNHRAGFLAIHDAARRDPRLAAAITQALYPQCEAVIRLARIKTETLPAFLIRAGLAIVYGITLCTWRRDDSSDLAKTMATLDRQLRRVENLMRFLNHRTD